MSDASDNTIVLKDNPFTQITDQIVAEPWPQLANQIAPNPSRRDSGPARASRRM